MQYSHLKEKKLFLKSKKKIYIYFVFKWDTIGWKPVKNKSLNEPKDFGSSNEKRTCILYLYNSHVIQEFVQAMYLTYHSSVVCFRFSCLYIFFDSCNCLQKSRVINRRNGKRIQRVFFLLFILVSLFFFFFLYTFAPNRFVQNLTKYAMWSSIFFFLMKKKKKKKRANNSQKKKRKDIIYRFTVLPRDNRTQVDVQQSVFVLNLRSLHNEKE